MSENFKIIIVSKDLTAKISEEDFEKCQKIKWSLKGGFPHNKTHGKLHKFIIGERPNDIDAKMIVCHIDNDPFNACRSNLRWAPQGFSNWNKKTKYDIDGKFKGVWYDEGMKKWRSKFGENVLGFFDTEKEAAMRSAAEAIKTFGDWITASQWIHSKFSQTEIDIILDNLKNDIYKPYEKIKKYPVGVSFKNGKFIASFLKKIIGKFDTCDEAVKCYQNTKQAHQIEQLRIKQEEYNKHPITVNSENEAIIKTNDGHEVLVDQEYWHNLTIKNTWHINPSGYAMSNYDGIAKLMHHKIYKMANPQISKVGSIDHKNLNKLDNRIQNLRIANGSQQNHNKKPLKNHYKGVWQRKNSKWYAEIAQHGTKYPLGTFDTEKEAALAYDQKAKELYKEFACLNFPE